jgi:hypothetical protein
MSDIKHKVIRTTKGFELQAIRDGKVVGTVTWRCRRAELSLADIEMVTRWFVDEMRQAGDTDVPQ